MKTREYLRGLAAEEALKADIADFLFSKDEYIGDHSVLSYTGKRASNANAVCTIMFNIPAEDDAMSFVRNVAEKFGTPQTMCQNGSHTFHLIAQCDVPATEKVHSDLAKTPWILCSPLWITSTTNDAKVCAMVVVEGVAGLDTLTLIFQGCTSHGKANLTYNYPAHGFLMEGWRSVKFSTSSTHYLPINLSRPTEEQKKLTRRGA